MKIASATYNLRLKLVLILMHVLTPKVYSCFKEMYFHPPINDLPRPMIKYIAHCHLKNLVGAEIGVSAGANAESMFKLLNLKQLYAIDPYTRYFENELINSAHVNAKDTAFSVLKDKPVVWLIEPSVNASKKIQEPLDFVYIDANHEYKNVKEDIESWYPHIRVGGVLGGHDYTFIHGGVVKAVTEFVESNKLSLYTSYPDWFIVREN
ncbi:MAG: class I SAM-dependent methyltransferase [Candidatus Bathyarchaeia archaeon]